MGYSCLKKSLRLLSFFFQNTAKKIFKLYSKGKPERVAEIILVSSLSGFSSGMVR